MTQLCHSILPKAGIVTPVLDWAIQHQDGRVTEKVTCVTFDFTKWPFWATFILVQLYQTLVQTFFSTWHTKDKTPYQKIPLWKTSAISGKTPKNICGISTHKFFDPGARKCTMEKLSHFR